MLGRLFGKNKDTSGEAVCAECGRTLLAGEWTQKIVDDDGNERLLCSLCGQAQPARRRRAAPGQERRGNAARAAGQDAGEAGAGPGGRSRRATRTPPSGRRSRTATPRSSACKTSSRAARPNVRSCSAAWPACRRPPAAEAVRPKPGPRRMRRPSRAGRAEGDAELAVAAAPDLAHPGRRAVAATSSEAEPLSRRRPRDAAPVAAEDTAEILAADLPDVATPDEDATVDAGRDRGGGRGRGAGPVETEDGGRRRAGRPRRRPLP